MLITFEDRAADSPVIDRVWRSHSEAAGIFHSMATPNWMMVVTSLRGKTYMTLRGPETRASLAECPAEGEWLGIHFKIGSFMPLIPADTISDRKDLNLYGSRRTFSLNGSTWEYPSFENAETFVNRMIKKGLITTDPDVVAALRNQEDRRSLRTEQRRFLQATGMTHATIRQIERARQAAALLTGGHAIADVVFELGYTDQSHLTKSLKHFIGQTPAQIRRQEEQLSLLYNSD